MTLSQAAARYLGTLPPGQRELATGEINRFVRSIGPNRPLNQIAKVDVDRYQQKLIDSGVDSTSRVEPIKAFLLDLKAKKLTETNLGAVLRVRRKGGGQAQREQAAEIDVTQEGLQQLQAELHHLENEVAPAVREDLAAAYQDRDFRENAPYDEAKRRMGEVQGRIDRLREMIKAAHIVERQASTKRAGLGSRVALLDLQYGDELEYTLVGPGEVDTRKGRISIQSPVGSALKDRAVGDEVEVNIPTGKARYRIQRIERSR
jgi:transcription elongation factor GreA